MGAVDNLAAAVAALLGILRSPWSASCFFASMLHILCTRNTADQPPRSKDRRTAVIGWNRFEHGQS